ncbi:MAG: hypothetical protein QOH68_194 [Nocardioidaceae bacterium]|jgi:hypothetical protein|nr:hypothetical protein [Nocardioidaceae bacterium]
MAVLDRLQREGVRRGVMGTSRAWTIIAVVSFLMRQARKLGSKQPQVVHCQELKPGESIIITHTLETHG